MIWWFTAPVYAFLYCLWTAWKQDEISLAYLIGGMIIAPLSIFILLGIFVGDCRRLRGVK